MKGAKETEEVTKILAYHFATSCLLLRGLRLRLSPASLNLELSIEELRRCIVRIHPIAPQ